MPGAGFILECWLHFPADLLRNRAAGMKAASFGKVDRTGQIPGEDDALALLCSYNWPGNIRELENAIEQAVALSNQSVLTPDDFPRALREPEPALSLSPEASDAQAIFADRPSLEEVKKRYLLYVLHATQGNVSATARILRVDRRSLYRMLARYKIEPCQLKDV